ncbi:interleukin-1 receptor-associated kinase-like 2 [Mya arenaria]|uniref:interleukin-1 receptor-associated kinase-like 2 n=1 Tax=Mya arenaria TaxID=6604 RepID=UPI0022E24049|nr:interleukin-1 receptor-associated kinase-like 2 [Mya arenaria]
MKMALRKSRNPDMSINDLDYTIVYQICQNFDVDKGWEHLAACIGYSVRDIQQFELEHNRPHGSASKKILWDWGTRGGTVRNLYDKLALINKTQSMRLLEHIVNPVQEKKVVDLEKVENGPRDVSSIDSKLDNNSIESNGAGSIDYNPGDLPIPSMKPRNMTINMNMAMESQDKPCNKTMGMLYDHSPTGAASMAGLETLLDGPASCKGNMGAASSSMQSLERVRSVVEDGCQSPYMSQLSFEEREIAHALLSMPNYTYKELSQATDGFSVNKKLGQGKYGAVYSGHVKNTKCAIKKLSRVLGNEEKSAMHMASELKALSRYHHENLVTLYGYAIDGDEVCLVYQYMVNKSLHDCLHGQVTVLTWEQRLAILKGAACGLQFLHSVEKTPVIHGDIKSSNILLDRHMEAKIGDLGLAQQATGGEVTGRLTHITRATMCHHDYENKAYYAPEISRGNVFSVKGDTYAFGVVLLETLTGQLAYDDRREGSNEEKYLHEYVQNALEESPDMERQKRFQDRRMKISFPARMFEALFTLALRCIQEKKKDRPLMVDVYKDIETCEAIQGHDYTNTQELDTSIKKGKDGCQSGKQVSKVDRSIAVDHISFTEPGSVCLKAPPPNAASSTKSLPSPVDMLPKGQPIPEAFKLQMEIDMRQKQPEYCNVKQLTNQMGDCMVSEVVLKSDTKKLAEIERSNKEFKYNLPTQPSTENNQEIGAELQCGVSEGKDKEADHNPGIYMKAKEVMMSDPRKQEVKQAEKLESHHYENVDPIGKSGQTSGSMKEVQESSFEDKSQGLVRQNATEYSYHDNREDIEDGKCSSGESFTGMEAEPFNPMDTEIEGIINIKHNSSMMELFNNFDFAKKDCHLDDLPTYEEDGEFEINFEFDHKSESETSTVTDSINHEQDQANSDDELFRQGSHVSCMEDEKISNNMIVAPQLDDHHRRFARYQEMATGDYDDLQERSAEKNVYATLQTDCTSQGGDDSIRSVQVPADFKINGIKHVKSIEKNTKNATSGQEKHSQDYVNVASMNNQRNLREASEGECPEYV